MVFLNFVRRPLYLLVAMYNDVANHVFETVLKHFSWQLFGQAEWVIRLPVFVAGCLLPPCLFLVIRSIYSSLPALLALALASGSSALLEYSVNARGYELLAFWTVLLLGLRHLLARRDNLFLWLIWSLVSALDFWTNPSAILSYGVIATWLLLGILCRPAEERLNGLARLAGMSLLGALLTVLLYSPILVSSGIGHMGAMVARGSSDLSLGSPVQRLGELASVYSRNLPAWLAALLGSATLAGLLIEPWRNKGRSPFFLAVILWLGFFLTIFPSFGFTRLWLPFAVFTYMMIGVGLGEPLMRLGSIGRNLGLILALGLGLAGIMREVQTDAVRNNPDGSFFEAKAVAAALTPRLQPGDVVFGPCPDTMPLIYALEQREMPMRILSYVNDLQDIQVFTRTDQNITLPWNPQGSFYLVLTDNSDSNLASRLAQKGFIPSPSGSQTLLPGLVHTKVYQLPMPVGLTLQ